MSIMVTEVFDALKDVGVSDEKTRRAAEALAQHESRFAKLDGDLSVLKWMVGVNTTLTLLVLGKLVIVP